MHTPLRGEILEESENGMLGSDTGMRVEDAFVDGEPEPLK